MPYHPSGILVDIVGINASDKGRSCEEHANCGSVLKIDTLVRFRSVQIWCDGQEEMALAVYWVTDGIDRCRVGFLPRHLLKHKEAYNGKLAQIVEFVAESNSPADRAKSHRCYGLCRAVLVEAEMEEDEENVHDSPRAHDDDGLEDGEGKHNEEDNTTYHTPTKKDTPKKKKERFHPVDSCVLKIMDILLCILIVIGSRCFGCRIS